MEVSIIIPVLNNLQLTKQCVESIWRNTKRHKYELIIIDNGSEQETEEHLKSLPDVIVIRNEANQGFTEAVNQGLKRAKGDHLFVLNNDTVLYPNWLERMVLAFNGQSIGSNGRGDISSVSRVGAVGPVSNFVMGKQSVSVGRRNVTPDQINKLVSLKKEQTSSAEFLIGFALMISREAYEEVGPLDERFFAGSDDFDYSLRLRRAGYELVIAEDVFVRHLGMKTSKGVLGKSQEFFDEGNQRFFDKWSEELGTEIKSHRHAFEVALGEKERELTICTIVKNEGGLADSMIKITNAFCEDFCIVDTGSTDDTAQTLSQRLLNNGRVLDYEWSNNFADARNFGLEHCRGKWILQLDADEVIPKQFAPMMRQMVRSDKYDAYRFRIINFRESPFLIQNPKKDILTSIRMWRNSDKIRYAGMIHETVTESVNEAEYRVGEAAVPILHYAYLKLSKRHFELMKQATEQEPKRSNNHYFLGEEYIRRGEWKLATICFRNALATSNVKHGDSSYGNKVQQMLDITQAHQAGSDLEDFPKDVHEHFRLLLREGE